MKIVESTHHARVAAYRHASACWMSAAEPPSGELLLLAHLLQGQARIGCFSKDKSALPCRSGWLPWVTSPTQNVWPPVFRQIPLNTTKTRFSSISSTLDPSSFSVAYTEQFIHRHPCRLSCVTMAWHLHQLLCRMMCCMSGWTTWFCMSGSLMVTLTHNTRIGSNNYSRCLPRWSRMVSASPMILWST